MEEFFEETKTDVNYTVDFIGYSQKTLAYGLYAKLNQFEQHFDTITTKYKNIALTWVLAVYAAIGFLLSNETTGLPFNHLVAVIITCVIGVIGISLIWHLDLNVYHRFWAAVFIEEIRFEREFKFLLHSRSSELLIDDNRERIFSQSLLYMIANILITLTLCVSVVFIVKEINVFLMIGTIIFFLFITFFICYFMTVTSKLVQNSFNKLIEKKFIM